MSRKTIISIVIILVIIAMTAILTLYISQRAKASDINDKLTTIFVRNQAVSENVFKADLSKIDIDKGFTLLANAGNDVKQLMTETRSLYPDVNSAMRDSMLSFLSEEDMVIKQYKAAHDLLNNILLTIDTIDAINTQDEATGGEMMNAAAPVIRQNAKDILIATYLFQDHYVVLCRKEDDLIKKMTTSSLKFTSVFERYKDISLDRVRQIGRYADKFSDLGK